MLVGFAGYTILSGDPADNKPKLTDNPFDNDSTPRNDSSPLELEANEPGPEPVKPDPVDPPPDPEREHVKLQALTRFRAFVTEADMALVLRDADKPTQDQLWENYSTLHQLDSRFAPYALLRYEGKDALDDKFHFEADVARAFERPDVASTAYAVDAGQRAAIWLREGALLPKAEPLVLTAGVPLGRRLQETVNQEVITHWLAAMESEYGKADFGDGALPLDIVLYPSLDHYLEFSRKRLGLEVPQWSAGYYSSRWDVICIPVMETTSLAEVIRHEMFHAVQAHRAPQSILVPWFSEGSAEWLDKAAPDPALRTLPEFASGAYGYLRALIGQGLEIDLKVFLSLGMQEFYQNPELNYLIAYCFVDFCRAEEDLRALYFRFWQLMCEGVSTDNAYARTFGGLDINELQRRFMARVNGYPKTTEPPRFSHDAPAEHFGSVPAVLTGGVAPPTREGEIAQGWFKVLGDLQARGFDTSRASFFKGDFDRIVVAVDHSESMSQTITTPNFDFDALSRWLFSLRYAGTLAFTRKSPDGTTTEEVPPSVLLTMVDSVLTGRVDEFIATAGINVGEQIQTDISRSYKKFDLSAGKLKSMAKRDIARHTAESVAWYWGTRQDASEVVVVDFNLDALTEKDTSAFKSSGFNSSASPLSKLFAKTAGHAPPGGSHGADTDWWGAFQSLVNSAGEKGTGKTACMFFTDGANSLGFYGHLESGRDDTQYMLDQEKLADALKLEWDNAGLGYDNEDSVLQLFVLPGAEGQGLDFIPQKITQAKLDDWTTHFVGG
ncbi:MAG: hypothetical protein K8I27_06845 [Planctomycetes bacterium]|nr:hypothetical protein [Planctomycetota bacterium]